MQTFLAYASLSHSLHVLDRARLGKQRIECAQLIKVITDPEARGWRNHPAARMWAAHVSALGVYMTLAIQEWQARGYVNTMAPPYDADWQSNPASPYAAHMVPLAKVKLPSWLGDPTLHASHRSALLRKDPDFYGQYGWIEPHNLEYVWPV